MKDKNLNKTEKKDIEILRALYFGHHLEPKELERASKLVYLLDLAVKERIRQ